MTSLIAHDPTPSDGVEGVNRIASETNQVKCEVDRRKPVLHFIPQQDLGSPIVLVCDYVDCSLIKDAQNGGLLAAQRYLGYNAVANLNNFLNAIYEAVLDTNGIAGLVDDKLVTVSAGLPSNSECSIDIYEIHTGQIRLLRPLGHNC